MGRVRVIFGGDVMLGRNVGRAIIEQGAAYPLAPVAALLCDADLAIVNLECAITESTQTWPGAPKAFYFGAPPAAADTLRSAGIELVSLANNHALDFGQNGLLDTIAHLTERDIAFAGAGPDLDCALEPALFSRNGLCFGMVAFCDHQEDFAATSAQPGIAWLDLEDEQKALATFARGIEAMHAREAVHWPILSLHWGPNFAVEPSAHFRKLAHAAIDLGYGIVYGHSAHHFQGIEVYKGRPIIYSTGDLVDDYAVDQNFRNDLQLLFELTLTQRTLESVRLHPLRIEECQVRPAVRADLDFIVPRMTSMCAPFGTQIDYRDGALQASAPSCQRPMA